MANFLKTAAVVVALALPWGAAVADTVQAGQITVTGSGQVALVPDMASIDLGVTAQAKTASAAMAANSAAMQAVMARIAAAGIAPRDMQTTQLNILPNWVQPSGDGAPEIGGYSAQNILSLRVRDLDRLGAVLDAAIQDGANTLQGLSFGHSGAAAAVDGARRAAVLDARARAQTLVAALGADLGKIVAITEMAQYDDPRPLMRMAAEAAPLPIAPGEVVQTAQVTVVFEIVQ